VAEGRGGRQEALGAIPHLRHEWASCYVEAGGDLVSLMEVGGWSQLSLVQRYAKMSHDRIRITLEKFANGTPDSTQALPAVSS
jgi:site-specific recombinase XerD